MSSSLFCIVHFNNQKLGDAYSVCCEVLSQRSEQIPQSLHHPSQAIELIEATSKIVESISYGDLIAMQEMDNELSITMKFYNLITQVAFFSRPEILPYLIHRMIQLTMKYGFCKYSAMGFINYGMVVCSSNKMAKESILNAARLGKAASSGNPANCLSLQTAEPPRLLLSQLAPLNCHPPSSPSARTYPAAQRRFQEK